MKILNADFLAGASSMATMPAYTLPEIAFAGRSNVGKSSLLNSIVLRRNLAHISSNPGKTQQINFFSIESKWIFVDMPGYGYASVGKQKREDWAKLNYEYLQSRKNLRLICALVDGRHDPMKSDLAFIEWLETNQLPYIIVLTKCDKLSKTLLPERKKQFDELLQYCAYCKEVLPYSSVTEMGRNELLAVIRKSTL